MINSYKKAIVVADGEKYDLDKVDGIYHKDTIVIFCDGAYNYHHKTITPNIVIGDMDSINIDDRSIFIEADISYDLSLVFAKNLNSVIDKSNLDLIYDNIKSGKISFIYSDNQSTSDLTKAMLFCEQIGIKDVDIIGINGKREDHFLGNFSLMFQYAEVFNINAISKWGIFTSIRKRTSFKSYENQKVSIFSLSGKVTAEGLKYELPDRLNYLHQGTLNESLGHEFSVNPYDEVALVYRVTNTR